MNKKWFFLLVCKTDTEWGNAPKPSMLLRRFVGGKHPEASIGSLHLFQGDLNSLQGLVLVCSWTGKRRGFGGLSACSTYLSK